MKLLYLTTLCCLLFSCSQKQDKNYDQRITRLEQKVDSLLQTPASQPSSSGISSLNLSPSTSGRCLATTKKGTQCKRNGKYGGYCKQHSS